MRKFLRRWYWRLPALLVAAGLGYVGYRAIHPPWKDAEAWEKYREVRIGMTAKELEAVLGMPPSAGDVPAETGFWPVSPDGSSFSWAVGEDRIDVRLRGWMEPSPKSSRLYWHVFVIEKSAVIQGHEFSDPADEPSWWDRWRARLGW